LPLFYDLFRDISAAGLILRADNILCEESVRFDVLDSRVKVMALRVRKVVPYVPKESRAFVFKERTVQGIRGR
jgi:hypothetical protein